MVNDSKQAILKVVSTCLASLKDLQLQEEGQPTPQQDIGALMKMITMDIFGQAALSHDLASCSELLEPSPIGPAFDFMGEELSRRLFNNFRYRVNSIRSQQRSISARNGNEK
jgi:hypothetical protein